MEYTVEDIVKELGKLGNKSQEIRNKIPVEMKKGDARHVCLSGIQTVIEPLMLSYGAIECSNQCINSIELSRVCGIKNRTNKEILDNFDTWAKLTLLVLVHFRIESLFSNLVVAIDASYKEKKFNVITDDLFKKITILDVETKKNCLKVLSMVRNSLHNNSINKNGDFSAVINGREFKFFNNKPTTATIFDLIFLIDYTLDILKEVIESPEISKFNTSIPDLFHVELENR